MTRVLFTSMPMAGHVRPLLPAARELTDAGHDVVWYTGAKYAELVTGVGARFAPFATALDYDDTNLDAFGDGKQRTGLASMRYAVLNLFVKPIPAYVADLERVFDSFEPQVVVSEHLFTAGLLLAEHRGVPRVVLSITPLSVSSVDTAPFGLGLPPATSLRGRLRNRLLNAAMRRVVFADSQRAADRIRRQLGLRPFGGYFMDAGLLIADRYVQTGIPEIEYPRRDLSDRVEFVGSMSPHGVDRWDPPGWWGDIETARSSGRPVVVVTQGTLATDPDQLLRPAVRALAAEDVLVVATTGGLDPDQVLAPGDRPANLRLERFVPHTELLPLADLMVTNGGFGGVQASLAHGVPLVGAGVSEDKKEVNARVAWSGAGVSLRTERPTPDQLLAAVRTVLADPAFRRRALELEQAFARYRGAARTAEIVLEAAAGSYSDSPRTAA